MVERRAHNFLREAAETLAPAQFKCFREIVKIFIG